MTKTHRFLSWHSGNGIVTCSCGSWSCASTMEEARREQAFHVAAAAPSKPQQDRRAS